MLLEHAGDVSVRLKRTNRFVAEFSCNLDQLSCAIYSTLVDVDFQSAVAVAYRVALLLKLCPRELQLYLRVHVRLARHTLLVLIHWVQKVRLSILL